MITFSVREVVEQAVQTEKLGKEFYTQMAEKFRDKAELKKLFELLAAHEARHGESVPSLENQLSDFN